MLGEYKKMWGYIQKKKMFYKYEKYEEDMKNIVYEMWRIYKKKWGIYVIRKMWGMNTKREKSTLITFFIS